ncbi:6-phosphogluconate dehydrogenase C-terminal domain-like protein [Mollisia scopiformis]|uniref:6-phosphogluconate dehydrogenase C-terminal domain-like protein n=1 Tax=Mollisia scopiformis TaxID=149040 RepID=A0A194WVM3_MOLSC|nr:6-phosphogluconate dehydrogenase C-terminal domain-like protein [Mollisia scopiformis]KUJ12021.1 6-phosphogluconate dehydrogenase C-terminal domain-like protein [Mollisia scopiformis]
MPAKANVLLIGGGSVGTMVAYNLETGGKATVTVVLRSNYDVKPTKVVNAVPRAETGVAPFDFIVVTTKNVPDIHPTLAQIISLAVTDNHTSIILVQNGLNIEKPLIAEFPNNTIISGVSLIGAQETQPGHEKSVLAARKFEELYKASNKVQCYYDQDVGFVRWRKLVYNACYNSTCAITRMNPGQMRLCQFPLDLLVRPLMQEILAIAKEAGHKLPDDCIEQLIKGGPINTMFKPSIQQDIEKGNFIEFENIVGEPLRKAERLGVAAPFLKVAYVILKVMQQKTKQDKGLLDSYLVPSFPLTPPEDTLICELGLTLQS